MTGPWRAQGRPGPRVHTPGRWLCAGPFNYRGCSCCGAVQTFQLPPLGPRPGCQHRCMCSRRHGEFYHPSSLDRIPASICGDRPWTRRRSVKTVCVVSFKPQGGGVVTSPSHSGSARELGCDPKQSGNSCPPAAPQCKQSDPRRGPQAQARGDPIGGPATREQRCRS